MADRFTHLNFLGALKANPLGAVAAAFFVVAIGWSLAHLLFAARVPSLQLTEADWRRVRWSLLAVFLVIAGLVLVKLWGVVGRLRRRV